MSLMEGMRRRLDQFSLLSVLLYLLKLQGTVLCDGDKPKDAFAPSQDCYDDNVNTELLGSLREECRGRYDCVSTVPNLALTSECDGKRREIRVQYSCGQIKHFWWSKFVINVLCCSELLRVVLLHQGQGLC